MKKVAKLVIKDQGGNYLLMRRGDHPRFGRDPDIPGGTLEEGESLLQGMAREVKEEIGVIVDEAKAREVYAGTEYSKAGTYYALFVTSVEERPEVVMSWEHSGYEWLPHAEFLETAKHAKDTYMHMVYEVLKG